MEWRHSAKPFSCDPKNVAASLTCKIVGEWQINLQLFNNKQFNGGVHFLCVAAVPSTALRLSGNCQFVYSERLNGFGCLLVWRLGLEPRHLGGSSVAGAESQPSIWPFGDTIATILQFLISHIGRVLLCRAIKTSYWAIYLLCNVSSVSDLVTQSNRRVSSRRWPAAVSFWILDDTATAQSSSINRQEER